jgi:Flp pilus assembly protein TadG
MKHWWHAVKDRFCRRQPPWPALRANQRGNVALTFALAFLPLMVAADAAVDYTRAANVRTALQSAVDATALLLSKDAPGLSETQVSQKASDYFNSLFHHPEASDVTTTAVFTQPVAGNFALTVTGTARVLPAFAQIWGHTHTQVTASSDVLWGVKRLEVALALDNTGSMFLSNKMVELKKAAHSLLDKLKIAAKKPDDVKVAIIPFDTRVHLGTTYVTELWFDWSQVHKHSWEGCVEDRTQPFDVQDSPPNPLDPSTLFPAIGCGALTKMLPLTADWTARGNKIDQMQPSGYTNVTIGLVWAWHALTLAAPLDQAGTPKPDLDKVIILLTDGDNTQNRWTTNRPQIDARTSIACANIKAANIRLYTVRVIDGNADLLRGCATSPSMYYDVQNAGELNKVFSAIAQNLANLRIAK